MGSVGVVVEERPALRASGCSGGEVVPDRQELITAAQRGEPAAVHALIKGVITPLAWRSCRTHLGTGVRDPAFDLDDVVQLVVLAVVMALPRFRADGPPFEAFVAGIARHKVVDTFRTAGRNRSYPVAEMPDAAEPDIGPEGMILQSELAKAAWRLIGELPARHQMILMLRTIHQWTAAETAAALGMTEGSVRVAHHRILHNLRTRVVRQAP